MGVVEGFEMGQFPGILSPAPVALPPIQPGLWIASRRMNTKEPLKLDIVISFPDHGFHIRFDPWLQRLRPIEIFDIKRLQIRGPSTLATFVGVYALFGPTFPGIYDQNRGVYTLFYPGLSFAFPIPTQYTECFHDGEATNPSPFSVRECADDDNVKVPSPAELPR